MWTSCDIDILVYSDNLDVAIACLSYNVDYIVKERATHDISLFSPIGIHIELHFDLVKMRLIYCGVVWINIKLHEGCLHWYEMTDSFFYFYHVAHIAKHFEAGDCGISPFIDLWVLDHMENVKQSVRDRLLVQEWIISICRIRRQVKPSVVWM